MSNTPRFNSYWNSYRSGAISVEEFKEAVQQLERENAALRELLQDTREWLKTRAVAVEVQQWIVKELNRKEAQP